YRAKSDVVKVTYRIAEGPPLLADTLTFAGAGDTLVVPDSLGRDWRRFVRTEQNHLGRAGEDERRALADSTVRWFRAHGYPFATAATIARVDSAANRASLRVEVKPGQRARIRRIDVAGNRTEPEPVIVRQLPVRPGDWYDARELEQARQQIAQMDIVRLAAVDVPPDSANDTSVVVVMRIAQNPEHLIKGEAGYISNGGVTSQTT